MDDEQRVAVRRCGVLKNRTVIRETLAMFPNQVRAIVQDRDGMRLALSEHADGPDSPPLWIKICNGNDCRVVVTFSGQSFQVAKEKVEVLEDAQGRISWLGISFSAGRGTNSFRRRPAHPAQTGGDAKAAVAADVSPLILPFRNERSQCAVSLQLASGTILLHKPQAIPHCRDRELQSMKIFFAIIMAALLTSGCSRQYTITTNSGGQIISKGRPHLEGNVYVYKDHQGRRMTVPAGRVREVAPSSMISAPNDKLPGSR